MVFSLTPALVYFPAGTYIVSSPIIATYYTQLVGDGYTLPVLKASSGFQGSAVIGMFKFYTICTPITNYETDGLPYVNGVQYTKNQNNFFRMVRNFVIDLRSMPASAPAKGFHWPAAQATTISNVVVEMSQASGTQHIGLYMENGSGGYMGGTYPRPFLHGYISYLSF